MNVLTPGAEQGARITIHLEGQDADDGIDAPNVLVDGRYVGPLEDAARADGYRLDMREWVVARGFDAICTEHCCRESEE